MIEKALTLTAVIIAYLVYARFVLSPYVFKNFSLIDDGQNIEYGYYFRECVINRRCDGLRSQVMDKEAGRSRIVYWLIQSVLYQKPLINAEFQHAIRIYGFGTLMVILFALLASLAKAHPVAIFFGAAMFVTNYSFSENMIRLGPLELYQIIFLAIFSLLFLNQRNINPKKRKLLYFALIVFSTLFLLVRETSIVLLPVVLILWLLFPREVNIKNLIIIFGLPSLIFFLAKKNTCRKWTWGSLCKRI